MEDVEYIVVRRQVGEEELRAEVADVRWAKHVRVVLEIVVLVLDHHLNALVQHNVHAMEIAKTEFAPPDVEGQDFGSNIYGFTGVAGKLLQTMHLVRTFGVTLVFRSQV